MSFTEKQVWLNLEISVIAKIVVGFVTTFFLTKD